MLRALGEGGEQPDGALFDAVYAELRLLAESSCGRGQSGKTLQPTALVHEAWLRLENHLGRIHDRQHFLALAALAMRQILANYAASARAEKRGGGRPRVTLTEPSDDAPLDPLDLVGLDDALAKLARLHERHARVVELRFLASLTIAETAAVLKISPSTVEADWAMARAWLRAELGQG